jgi:hypothetical protein
MKTFICSIRTIVICTAICINTVSAQTVDYKIVGNDVESFRKLNIRPYLAFFIPPTSIAEGFINAGIDAQYHLGKIANFNAGFSVGTFNGFTGGITYHLVDKIKSANYKFVVSRSKRGNVETINYFKAKADARIVIGPSLDISAGVLTKAGFYTKIDFGLDYQSFGRAYADLNGWSIAGNRNGWVSMKLQGVFASMNRDENKFDATPAVRRIGIGGQVALSTMARPWRGVTLYAGLPLGVMKIMGVEEDAIQPILQINLGMSINVIK